MRTTGKFDQNGEEIFEGNKVMKWWGWFRSKGSTTNYYKLHIINIKPAYMMANGEMADDGGGIIFCLGSCFNSWEGKGVVKLTAAEVEEIGIPDDTAFFLNDEGKAVICTDQHFMGLSDEDWAKELERRMQLQHDLFFGKESTDNNNHL